MAEFFDILCVLVLGGWAYLTAKARRRDEVGWAIVAAAAFYVVGMAMEKIIAPKAGLPEGWIKPSGFLAGGLAGVVANLILIFKPPLRPPAAGGGPGGEAGPGAGGEGPEAEEPGQKREGADQMAVAQPARERDPLAFLARYWPTLAIVALYLATQFEGVTEWLKARGYEAPFPPVREAALVVLVGAQTWLMTRKALPSVLAAILCAAYIPAINWMEWRWGRGSSYYSHGYLIPFVVAWLIWMNRGRLARLQPKDDFRRAGLSLLLFGLLLDVGGTFIRAFTVQGISLVLVLCGLAFFLYGRAIGKIVLFPLLFTLAMVPLPMAQVTSLTFKLKMLATRASVEIMDLLFRVGLHNYIVIKDGSYVKWDTPSGQLDQIIVGDVCSGLRSLIALLAFGALFAYIAKLSTARKLLLFVAAVPIALAANMWRIVTITIIACRWGSEATHGWVHDATGYGIFAVAFVLFFSLERVLRLFEPSGKGGQPPQAPRATGAGLPA